MERKNIFQQLSDQLDFRTDIKRIYDLVTNKNGIVVKKKNSKSDSYEVVDHFSIIDAVDFLYFKKWKQRGRFIRSSEMFTALGLTDICYPMFRQDDGIDILDFLSFLEFEANILNLIKYIIAENSSIKITQFYAAAEKNLAECLSLINFELRVFDDEEKVIICEQNPAATAVAEIVEHDVAYDVIRYNHFLLKGDIETKRAILLRFGNELEPRRKSLRQCNSSLEDDIFTLFNNLNLRHNNTDKEDKKHYHQLIEEMSNEDLESLYDELYQMILLAYLELDQVDRHQKIVELKKRLSEKN